ncbi:MAG: DUF4199 domain-containing protein [Burkholderiaceae bacterium]|nr:DUF4199 domain-containing protein [Burkholderiaceae bacterium]
MPSLAARTIRRHGLIAGAILSAAMLATLPWIDAIGFDRGALVGYAGMVLAFLMVFFGVRAWRDGLRASQPDRRVRFWPAFGVGAGIAAVGSVCYALTWQVVQRLWLPDFAERYAAYAVGKARAAGASAEQLAALTRDMADFARLYENPLVNIGFSLLEPLPIGLLFAGVSAWWFSRR